MKVGDLVEMNYPRDLAFDLDIFNGTLGLILEISSTLPGCFLVVSHLGIEEIHAEFLKVIE